MKKFYTLQEASSLIRYSERRIRQFCIEGDLKAVKLPKGRKWLIPVNAVEEFLNCERVRHFLGYTMDRYVNCERVRHLLGYTMDRYVEENMLIVTDTIFLEFYNWLIANRYEPEP